MQTKRTTFSIPRQSDYQDLLKLKSNEQVRKYLGGAVSEANFKCSFENIISVNKPEIYWIVRDKKNNKASIRVLEKLGMIFEKEVKRHNETQVIYGIQNTTS